MVKKLLLAALFVSTCNALMAQTTTLTTKQIDSIRFVQLQATKIYPLISKWGGILPVEVSYKPSAKLDYKLLFDLYFGRWDSVNVKVANSSLTAMARLLNLHAGAGIPKEKMTIVGLVHNTCLDAFLTNERYLEIYGTNNPSLPLIRQYLDLGARFIACGQTIAMNGRSSKDFIPELKIALTAQAVLSEHLAMGFTKF